MASKWRKFLAYSDKARATLSYIHASIMGKLQWAKLPYRIRDRHAVIMIAKVLRELESFNFFDKLV